MISREWTQYWQEAAAQRPRSGYAMVAEFYRNRIIAPATARVLARHFRNDPACRYLHAGCGSGGSDRLIALDQARLHCLDISPIALALHQAQPLTVRRAYCCADIFALPYAANTFDGLFNLGVMEHFSDEDLGAILAEFHRVVRADGTLVLFWPPEFGLSVMTLKVVTGVVNRFRNTPLALHPPEVSRIRSFRWIQDLMVRHRFRVVALEFGWRDLFTHVVVVAQKA